MTKVLVAVCTVLCVADLVLLFLPGKVGHGLAMIKLELIWFYVQDYMERRK